MSKRKKTTTTQPKRPGATFRHLPDGAVEVRKPAESRNRSCAVEMIASGLRHQALAWQELEAAVLHARIEHGFTWQEVADELGITRQAVQKRYAVAEHFAAQGN